MADAIETMGDDWLAEAEAAPQEPQAEAKAPEPATPPEEPPAPAEGDAEPVSTPEPRQVPLSALQEERSKRQALERRMADLEARTPPPAPARPQPVIKAPDPYEDPDGYDAFNQNRLAQTEWKLRAEMSGRFAETRYGKETVEAAVAWAQEAGAKDPSLGQRVQAQASPVEFVVEEYQRSQTLQTLSGKSLEDYARDYAVSQGWIVSPGEQPPAAPNLKPPSPTPPKSLSQAPGNGGLGSAPKGADWGEVKFALG